MANVSKNKCKRPISSIKKQASAPIKYTNKILPMKKTSEKSLIVKTMSLHSLRDPGSNHTSSSSFLRSSQSKIKSRFIDRSENVQLNKIIHDKEIQTSGISIEQLENENTMLNLELDDSKKAQTSIMLDLAKKNEELLTLAEQNSALQANIEVLNCKIDNFKNTELEKSMEIEKLQSHIEILNDKIDHFKNTELEKTRKIEKLFRERKKLKIDFAEISRLRDEAAEEIIVVKNKYTKANSKLLQLRSFTDDKRKVVVQGSIQLSEQIDDLNKKQKQIDLMENIISEHELLNNHLTLENRDHINNIARLEADGKELRNDLIQWETRAGCWINNFVRDEYETKIEDLEKKIQKLNAENLQLSDTYRKAVSEKCDVISKKEEIIEIKQSKIEKISEIISLMRKVNVHESNFDHVREMVDNCCLEFDKTMKRMQHFEDLVKENGRLQMFVNDLKQRLKSNPFKQLL